MSRYKECDTKADSLLSEIDHLSNDSDGHEGLLLKKLKAYQSVKDQKMDLADKIKSMIVTNVDNLSDLKIDSKLEIINYNANDDKPSTSVRRESIEDTPSKSHSFDELRQKQKKVKKALIFEHLTPEKRSSDSDSTSDGSIRDIVNSPHHSRSSPDFSNLYMLADVACERKAEEHKNTRVSPARKPIKAGRPSKKFKESIEIKSELDSDQDEEEREIVKRKKKPPKAKVVNADDDTQNEPLYCTCSKPYFGRMIACDNESCPLEWFHFDCVGLKRSPKGKW